jgi:hypothetical protein
MRRGCIFLTVAAAALVGGCATAPKEEPVAPLTREEAGAFLARARPPQVFGITIYPTETGPVFVGGNRPHAGQVATLAFDKESIDLAPLVGVKSTGSETMRALIDTGSGESWMTLRVAAESKVTPLTGPPPFRSAPAHVADRQSGYLCQLSRLKFDTLSLESVLAYARAAHGNLGPLCRFQEKPRPDLVIGCNVLSSLANVQFDFAARTVTLASTAEPYIDDVALLAIVPLKDVAGAAACDALLDGQPVVLILDTGGDFALAMNEPPKGPVHRLCVGDLVLRDTPVSSHAEMGLRASEYPRLGRKVLSRFRTTLDYHNKLVYIERSTGPAEQGRDALPEESQQQQPPTLRP